MGDGGPRASQPKHPTGGCGRFPQGYCDHQLGGVVTDQADTPDPIGEWLAAAEDATEGPWAIDSTPGFEFAVRTGGTAFAIPSTGEPVADAALDTDATFIAASRNVVPAVRALVAELAAARDREAAVLALHRRDTIGGRKGTRLIDEFCAFDAEDWPCRTVAALSQSEPTKETP